MPVGVEVIVGLRLGEVVGVIVADKVLVGVALDVRVLVGVLVVVGLAVAVGVAEKVVVGLLVGVKLGTVVRVAVWVGVEKNQLGTPPNGCRPTDNPTARVAARAGGSVMARASMHANKGPLSRRPVLMAYPFGM